jgi:ribosomal protein L16 Arg81 hydroxylase
VIRADQHGSTGELHFNQYETLVFGDTAGRRWQLYAADQPKHYVALSSDSGLDAVLDVYNLPTQEGGDLSLLRKHGARVDFSTGSSSE